jgi:spore coat protein H
VDEVKNNYISYQQSYEKPMPFYIGSPVSDGHTVSLQWDVAYTFDAETVTYTVELATDWTFAEPIFRQSGLKIPAVTFELPPAGQYFIRVIATDASGQTQTAFDTYMATSGKVYGTKCFYVNAKGEIVEDIYVEE